MQFLPILIVWLIVSVLSAKVKKVKQAQQNAARPVAPVNKPTSAIQKPTAAIQRQKSSAVNKEKRKTTSASEQKHQVSSEKPVLSEGDSLYNDTVQGSIVYDSVEGEDTCDDSLLHGVSQFGSESESDAQKTAGPSICINLDAVRNGFVMSEIINEPAWKRMYR